MERILLYFVIKYQGNWDQVYSALDNKEKVNFEDLQNIEEKVKSQYLTILNPMYPKGLRSVYKPPFVIFYEGKIELLKNYGRLITITGGLKCNDYVSQIVEDFTKNLIKCKKVIITGFNLGVETKVHQIAKQISDKPSTIAVISRWHNWTPSQKELLFYLKQKHLVISQYPFMMFDDIVFSTKQKSNYQLLLGLAKSLLVLPFKNEKYVNDLLKFALEEQKDLFAVPDQIYEETETNKLIKTCAKLVENIDDLL